MTRTHQYRRGFSIVEMLVAVAIFSVVMLVTTTALLSIVDANRKARAIHSVMNNLNFAMDNMSREIRTGYTYHCRGGNFYTNPNVQRFIADPRNCANGGKFLSVESSQGNPDVQTDQVIYRLDTDSNSIMRSDDGGDTYKRITAPAVTVERLDFYVTGARRGGTGDEQQPKVTIVAAGTAGEDELASTFRIQTTVSQRLLDF